MLERMQETPQHALALKASGTVMARDVEAAIEAALGSTTAATGLVVVVDRDFDGYFAELSRGLATVALAHKNMVRIAVVTEADRMDEAKLCGWSASPVPIRLFAANERRAAYDWADGVRRGE
ncbi:STAS/SEC14 domain-containing protein [Roseiarcus sp.]|jgi:hypothetical protein|uniref:STAS/SEC14 domain-containing protein n=1 Tax=Roseiarcus sp. TaxID=1969460 RepID=UPI003F9C7FC3